MLLDMLDTIEAAIELIAAEPERMPLDKAVMRLVPTVDILSEAPENASITGPTFTVDSSPIADLNAPMPLASRPERLVIKSLSLLADAMDAFTLDPLNPETFRL